MVDDKLVADRAILSEIEAEGSDDTEDDDEEDSEDVVTLVEVYLYKKQIFIFKWCCAFLIIRQIKIV